MALHFLEHHNIHLVEHILLNKLMIGSYKRRANRGNRKNDVARMEPRGEKYKSLAQR